MSQKFDKLKALLRELFQLDQPELDFGLYRIMHAKSGEISRFLDDDLLSQVRAAFEQYQSAERADVEKDLEKVIAGVREARLDPDQSPRVKELRGRLASEAVDVAALEADVYDHLYAFFRRYYSEGDFLSKRVYKANTYAIPYEGEEVKLHWANADQYYIKSGEYLRDYAFRLKPDDLASPMRVHFRLVDAAEGEHGTVREPAGKERKFSLAASDPVSVESGELVVRFTYQPNAAKQKELIAAAEVEVLASNDPTMADWIARLRALAATEREPARTVLGKHLKRYSDINTFDYFIHKDLGAFLTRELDFYIKNEVMHLDDLENESVPRVEQYLSKIKVIRLVAGRIIDLLAQLETFQKRLWLKKKFVVATSWLVRLDQVPPAMLEVVMANDEQRRDWVETCAIDRLAADGYTIPLTRSFLDSQPSLMLDTRHFPRGFVDELIDSIHELDDRTDGVLLHGDNFQGLSLIQAKFRDRVHCIYIDPPYNTDASAIDYKNGYKASSWMALLADRIGRSAPLLTKEGVLVAAIDDEQHRELSFLLSDAFRRPLLGTVVVRANPSGRPTQSGYAVSHEYLLFAGRSSSAVIGRLPPTDKQLSRFSQRDIDGVFEWRNLRREGSNSDRSARRALYYPIYLSKDRIRVPLMEWEDEGRSWKVLEDPLPSETAVWPINEAGVEKTWRWEAATVMSSLPQLAVRADRTGQPYVYVKRRPHQEGVVSVSSWFDARYSATEHGTAWLKALFGKSPFTYPKSIHAVVDAIYVGGARHGDATVLDYFAGSGTTGEAVIRLNRALGGRRKFVLIDQAGYFDSVLINRLKKVAYSPEWENGKPARQPSRDEVHDGPRLLKIIRLESYEDTLSNLAPSADSSSVPLFAADRSAPEYSLAYSLAVDTRGGESLLNVDRFVDPSQYNLIVKRPGSDESTPMPADLMESFNWLLGLSVTRLSAPQRVSGSFSSAADADLAAGAPRRMRLDGALSHSASGSWWFRPVRGTVPDGRSVLIVWRNRPGSDDPVGVEQDNIILDAWFASQGYADPAAAFDLVYVNGSCNLAELRPAGARWNVRLIEDDFRRLMFEAADA